MATAASLQGHFDEISTQAAVLPLAAAPRGFAQLEIPSLAEGPEAASKVVGVLNNAAAGLQECQICSCSCSSGQLGFLVTTQLDFAARSVRAAAGQFACEVCRALSSPGLLLELSMPVPQSEDFTRAEQLRELFLHFAAVNAAPERITRNPEALAPWVQELASRAYSMHVVASSLKGWQLHSPSGQLVQPGAAGAAMQLLQELLHTGAGSKPGKGTAGKRKEQQQQQQQLLNSSKVKPAKRKPVEVLPEAAAAAAGSSKKKAKKQVGTPAAAAPAGQHTPVQEGQMTPKQLARTPKQHKQQQHAQTPKLQQQQQQQQEQTPKKQLVKTPKAAPAPAPAAAGEQPLLQAGGTSSKKKTGSHTANGQAAGKKLKKAAAAAAVPFKTPQVTKAKQAKRRLSAE